MIELDALDRDRRGVDLGAEGERRENGELVGRVEAADVESGIRLGVAEPLRLGETDVERQVVGLHPGKDVVAGTVEDAGNAPDRVADQALAQRLDDRDAAADSRLEKELPRVRLGQRRQPQPVRGEHRLVGGDHREAPRQSRLDRLECDAIGPADQLDEHVDSGGGGHRRRILEEARATEIEAALALMARAVGGKNALAAGPRGQSALPLQKLDEASSNHAEACNAQAQRLCHDVLAPLPGLELRRRWCPSSGPGSTKHEIVQPHRSATDFFFFLRSLRAA